MSWLNMIQTWFGVRQGADQSRYLGTLGIQHFPIFLSLSQVKDNIDDRIQGHTMVAKSQ